jgi:hypothetical protein
LLGKTLLQKGYSPNPFPKTLNDFLTPMDIPSGLKNSYGQEMRLRNIPSQKRAFLTIIHKTST